jgi:AcrR family transcriptional regulator
MNLPRGRPRDQHADAKILKAAMGLLEQHGFRAMTLEGIAEEAGVARATVYRQWPNKAAVVMDAFLTHVAPRIAFPEHPVAYFRPIRDRGAIIYDQTAEVLFPDSLQ